MALLLILLLSGIVSVTFAGKINNLQNRIVNGEDATLGEIPFIVSLHDMWTRSHFCGGFILNENYVISAAHCVQQSRAQDIYIVAGSTDLYYPQVFHRVVKVHAHSKYNPYDSYKNDICLLKVDPPFEFTKTVAPFTLPDPNNDYADKIAVIAGWGQLDDNKPISRFLKKSNVPILSNKRCSYDYTGRYNIYKEQICAHDKSERHGSCYGDSGGPLFVDDNVVVGVVSWADGYQCSSLDYPTVYTRVSEYLDWIEKHTK